MTPEITLVVMTDGRDLCLRAAIGSARAHLIGNITRRVLHDDTDDPAHRELLSQQYPDFEVIGPAGGRAGFGGAYENAWRFLARCDQPLIFSMEDDFVFNRAVDLVSMAALLGARPNLVQLALRRQPWNAAEVAAGGIVEQHPEDYQDMSLDFLDLRCSWLEHRRFFTTNPSLYRRSLCERGWPNVARSEGIFSIDLFRDPEARCGFWGSRESQPWVHHIGIERVGTGY